MLEPLCESRSVFLLHRHKLHTHSLFGLTPLHDSTRAYLTCGNVKQQLDESSGRRRFRSENVQPALPDIVHSRDNSRVGSLLGQNRPFRTGETRVATKLGREDRHSQPPAPKTMFEPTNTSNGKRDAEQ
jgi:hypothetical protein